MNERLAEIIAIGDEMTSGQRLDTNSQWLSQRLAGLGIETAWHSTVRDDLGQQTEVFRIAASRASIVIATGGLGPTADDLTRQALSQLSCQPLVRDPAVLAHIERLFACYGRQMPETNVVQADFPAGSAVIPNAEGTAPGIDMTLEGPRGPCRFFCLPGVPAEMFQMWDEYVAAAILAMEDLPRCIEQRVINCFGAGESQIEGMLPDMIVRGRQPRIGITASRATISLRISAIAETRELCQQMIQRDESTIAERLGSLVFGSGEETLEEVVISRLRQRGQTFSVVDFGLNGTVSQLLAKADPEGRIFRGGVFARLDADERASFQRMNPGMAGGSCLATGLLNAAMQCRSEFSGDFGLAISPIAADDTGTLTFSAALAGPDCRFQQAFLHVGHSGLRLERSVKQVLNAVRLWLDSADDPNAGNVAEGSSAT